MSRVYLCDGCGKPIATTPQLRGVALTREYCEACAEIAKTFEEAESALRASLYERFTSDRGLLIAKFSEGGFKLPDVSYG